MAKDSNDINFKLKDVVTIIVLIVGMVASYFGGQINSNNRISQLETRIEVLETKSTTVERDLNRIYDNKIKQDENSKKISSLIYTLIGGTNKH